MTSSIDSRSARTWRSALVGLVTLALLAGSLALAAASPPKVLAATKTIDVTLPVGRTISGKILKKTGTSTTAAFANVRIQACLVTTGQGLCKSTYTAVDGTYIVKQLAAGKYTIEIVNDDDTLNYQSGWYTTANTAHFTSVSTSATQVDVTTTNKTGINATVPFGFKISGIVYLGSTATHIAGADVEVCGGGIFTCRFVVTNSTGAYSAIGLAPGQYTIRASKDDMNYVSGYYRSGVTGNFTLDGSLATKLSITSANLTGKNIVLPVGFKITGFVKTTSNVAIAGAGVTASNNTRYESSTTSSTGAFTIQGLPAGSYTVAVTNPYAQPQYADVFYKSGVTGQYTYDPAASTLVVITTANKALGTIWEPVGRTISGKVTHLGVALQGSTVTAVPVSTSSSLSFFFFFGGGYSTSAADGTWTIKGLRPTTYRINAPAPYYPPANIVGGYYKSGATGNYTRNLEQGTIVDVTTASKATLPIDLPSGNTIHGTIWGGAVGLANANVTVYSINNTEFSYGYATTGATGTYSITGLPNGRFIVVVTAPYGSNYQDGFYRNAPTPNFTRLQTSATPVIFGDGTLPTITGRSPASGATGVSRTANVTATFSEAVLNATTRTFYLRKAGTATNVSAVVTYDATTHKATLNPGVTLAASTSYTVAIYDIYDPTGNQVTYTTWSFKTGL
jgi:hypothetical protein